MYEYWMWATIAILWCLGGWLFREWVGFDPDTQERNPSWYEVPSTIRKFIYFTWPVMVVYMIWRKFRGWH
jgi:hypothetical protein